MLLLDRIYPNLVLLLPWKITGSVLYCYGLEGTFNKRSVFNVSTRSAMIVLPPFDASVHLQAPATTTRFKKIRDADETENVSSSCVVISCSEPLTCAFNSQIPHLCLHIFSSVTLGGSSDQRSSSWSRRRLPWLSPSSWNFYFVIFWELSEKKEKDFQDLKTCWHMMTPLLPSQPNCCLPCLIPMAPAPPPAWMLRSCFTGIVLLLSRLDHFEWDNCCI